jgi:hypothetical protein
MTQLEAKMKVESLLRQANEEMVYQNTKSSVSRSYGYADQLRRQANQIREKYNI